MDTWWINAQQLDDDQRRIIDLPLGGSYLVLGPPGSGKTNLLLLRANYLVKAGYPNLMVVVFTRTLREFIVQGASRYSFSASKVSTSTKWHYDLLKQFGGEAPSEDLPFEENRLQLLEQVRALITSKRLNKPFEAILLDEAQDYLPEELEVFARLGQQIFIVADSRQQIYRHNDGLQFLQTLGIARFELRHHYRNGRAICRFADGLARHSETHQPLLDACNYDERRFPSTVRTFACNSLEEQVEHIQTELSTQLKAYPDELLGVLCPRRAETDKVAAMLQASSIGKAVIKQTYDDGYMPFSPDARVCVSTIHGSKGLEFRAVHAAGLEHLRSFPMQRNLAFTLATRAQTSLSLYCSGDFPGYLEQAMVTVSPPATLPTINAAFGIES